MNYELLDEQYAFEGELGALYSKGETEFRLWAPTAESVTLRLFGDRKTALPYAEYEMNKEGGTFFKNVQGDLNGVYYTYAVNIGGTVRETADPYAKTAGVNGLRGMVIAPNSADPEGWERDRPVKLKSYCDAVLYELHVRDLSMDTSAGFKNRGRFLAFCEEGVKNSFGDTVGLEYIAGLGVTHIHLLPVCDYQSVDESGQGSFNWGYDPLAYFYPEGSYSSDPYDGFTRVRELKALVMAAHKKGLGIVLDVVYNHTFATEESTFNKCCPDYFYRRDSAGVLSNGSGCGNEIASERKMVRKLIIDSLCHLAREYHLDGFRFDLMGLLDLETVDLAARALRKINPDIILYGEGWTGGDTPLAPDLRALKQNARRLEKVAMFSDDFRDSVKGSVFEDKSKGYINGGAGTYLREKLKSVISGGIYRKDVDIKRRECFAASPEQVVNYVEAHDNLTFFDKLSLTVKSPRTLQSDLRFGAALVFLSQGIPFIQAGQEFARSKPLLGGGFDHNSYASPDSVNCLKWDDLTQNRALVDYYRGLIEVRKKFPALRMKSAAKIRREISFTDLDNYGFIVNIGTLRLIVNPSAKALSADISGTVYADGRQASARGLYRTKKARCRAHGILLIDTEAGA